MNLNSMKYWFPKLETLGLPVPRTIFTEINPSMIQVAAEQIGYPVFIRTDLCSGKHDWEKSCYLQDDKNIVAHIQTILDANVRWKMLGIEPEVMVVREFLRLKTAFIAFAGNMPINKEFRYFVEEGSILCSHPYWPITAFNNHPARMTYDSNWSEKLSILSILEKDSKVILDRYAETIAKSFSGCWSVDFAQDVAGKWWVLDMALGENSYHYPH